MQNLNSKFKILIITFLFLPFFAGAQTLLLKSPKATYQAGDSFQVTLSINTEGKQINTIAGKILVPPSKLQILDTRYGSSILTLWVERPKINVSAGTISFAGGLPGGFSGSSGPILSFGVKAKSEGVAEIKLSDFTILLNDGLGTEIKNIGLGALKLTIQKAAPLKAPTVKPAEPPKPKEEYILPPDTTPPESFIPIVSRHPTVADNKYFVSFSAVDKDSGVAYYEIRERPRIITRITAKFDKGPEKVEPPYILKIQHWPTEVVIKAHDQAGNFTESSAKKPPSALLASLGIVLLLILTAGFTYLLSTHPSRAHRKRVV